MSTRSTIIYSDNTGNHIWEETNEPVYYFDKYIGDNVHGVIDFDELKSATVKDGSLILTFKEGTYFHHLFPDGFTLFGGCLIDFEIDEDGVSFGIKGDHQTFIKRLKDAVSKPKQLS